MNIVIRADSSTRIGSGHIMRCLTLAQELERSGGKISFVCRELPGNHIQKIVSHGFELCPLPGPDHYLLSDTDRDDYQAWLGVTQKTDAAQTLACLSGTEKIDLLIVDHYGLDHEWESMMRNKAGRIIVIDDLANRQHDCDILIDQNHGRSASDYAALVSDHSRIYTGADYALLRDEFRKGRAAVHKEKSGTGVKNLLVSMGGMDEKNITGLVLGILASEELTGIEKIVVVLSAASPHLDAVSEVADRMKIECEILLDVSNMAMLMSEADLAIGASGTTSWERCCLGLPAITIAVAGNQRMIAESLHHTGAAIYAGTDEDVKSDIQCLLMPLNRLMKGPELLQKMARCGMALVDGEGSRRVGEILLAKPDKNNNITAPSSGGYIL